MKYKEKESCRVCGSRGLKMILDLKDQPLANSYHKPEEKLEEYPLKLNLCTKCYHSQLSVVVDPNEMFKNYLYVSGTTRTLRKYFEQFFYTVLGEVDIQRGKVLDIACNDGTQLEIFDQMGWETYGVDPAENLYKTSSQKGFTKIVCDYFNKESALKLGAKMDVIIAQNVFAHTDDIYDFLSSCKLISHQGTKIFIQTSQADMFLNNEFDTIYHEHLSFFNVNSMRTCALRNGLYLEGAHKMNIHGTSYLFVLSSSHNDYLSVGGVLDAERKEGRTSLRLYDSFAKNAEKVVNDLKKCISLHRERGYSIVGYGAAAKANTLLNFGKINLDFIIDDNPLKQGLLTPGMDIPIKSSESLRSDNKMLIIPLAWNFYNEIKSRVEEERNNPEDVFVRYFPSLSYG
jgi:2-polyprenyl-3-methyl-5-hydroxy-6-metoxy-1,4-benzoquinol methylase